MNFPEPRNCRCGTSGAPATLAIWDNFCTTASLADLGDNVRELHRVAAWSPSVRPALDRDTAIEALMQNYETRATGSFATGCPAPRRTELYAD